MGTCFRRSVGRNQASTRNPPRFLAALQHRWRTIAESFRDPDPLTRTVDNGEHNVVFPGCAHEQENLAEKLRSAIRTVRRPCSCLETGLLKVAFVGPDGMSDRQTALPVQSGLHPMAHAWSAHAASCCWGSCASAPWLSPEPNWALEYHTLILFS